MQGFQVTGRVPALRSSKAVLKQGDRHLPLSMVGVGTMKLQEKPLIQTWETLRLSLAG